MKENRNRLMFLIAVVTLAGCRSFADYKARDLPTELRAMGSSSPRRMDLTAIARQAINQDVIYVGDVLDVTVTTGLEDHPTQAWPVRVGDDGSVDVPLIGSVQVAGLGLEAAEQAIRAASIQREIFQQPHVAVLMKARKTIQVRVLGAVETPGVYQLPAAGSDVLAALVAAGGFTEKAGTLIEIRHPNSAFSPAGEVPTTGVALASFLATPDAPPRVTRIDLAQLAQHEMAADLHVEDGSIVMVKERQQRSISVMGLVRRPDSYELPDDEETRVLDALALAGGLTVSVADKVRLIRHVPESDDPIIIAVSIRQAKKNGKENLILAPGDIVVVEETATTVVVDTLRGFFRFGFTSAIPGL
jgi:protein involved in polysaccharide export with SLBB domain